MTKQQEAIARLRAKQFAKELRDENWARFAPESWEVMTDEQIKFALSILPNYGLIQRADMKWEYNRRY